MMKYLDINFVESGEDIAGRSRWYYAPRRGDKVRLGHQTFKVINVIWDDALGSIPQHVTVEVEEVE